VESIMRITPAAAPVREQVFLNVRSAILKGRFRPGDRLIEKNLCDLTGASRTAVREALRQLESEGLVTVIPNRGPAVAVLSPQEARDLYDIRALLEGHACKLFTERASVPQRQALEAAVEGIAVAYGLQDPEASLTAKNTFYNVLLEGAGNRVIRSTLEGMHARISLLWATSLAQPGRPAQSLSEIQAILEAVREGNGAAAERACAHHVQNAAKVALGALESSGEARPVS
jgi:GntR family transcriptional regulator, trigonelline degradation regulator